MHADDNPAIYNTSRSRRLVGVHLGFAGLCVCDRAHHLRRPRRGSPWAPHLHLARQLRDRRAERTAPARRRALGARGPAAEDDGYSTAATPPSRRCRCTPRRRHRPGAASRRRRRCAVRRARRRGVAQRLKPATSSAFNMIAARHDEGRRAAARLGRRPFRRARRRSGGAARGGRSPRPGTRRRRRALKDGSARRASSVFSRARRTAVLRPANEKSQFFFRDIGTGSADGAGAASRAARLERGAAAAADGEVEEAPPCRRPRPTRRPRSSRRRRRARRRRARGGGSQWPPETSSVRNGKSTVGRREARHQLRAPRGGAPRQTAWRARARAPIADSQPTRRQISRPGRDGHRHRVDVGHRREPRPLERLRRHAVERFRRARRAPRRARRRSSCSAACDASASPRMVPSLRTTATPVSSQLVSIPSAVNGLSCGGSPDAAPGRPVVLPAPLDALGRPTCARDAGPRDDALQRRRRTPARMETASGRRSNAASAIKEGQGAEPSEFGDSRSA